MPKVSKTPAHLEPYLFHGIDLSWEEGDEKAIADCPWCGKEGKFDVRIDTGLWLCRVCGAGTDKGGGNLYTFLRMLHEKSDEDTTDYSGLLDRRKLLDELTLMKWGAARHYIRKNCWILPGYGIDGSINQIYVYFFDNFKKRFRLLPTPGLNHALFGPFPLDEKKPDIYVCEGPWDGMALWEVMRQTKIDPTTNGFALTGNEAVSMFANANIIAVPGCTTFQENWLKWLFPDRRVFLLYDSDHPTKNEKTGVVNEPAGLAGMKRVANLMATADEPPKMVYYLNWGPNGYDSALPSGYDIRDILTKGNDIHERIKSFGELVKKLTLIPNDWVVGRSKKGAPGGVAIEPVYCNSWKLLIQEWRKAMHWTRGLDHALAVMFACVTSTKSLGDQLWCKIIGPASCGKSTLCEALSTNRKYILPKSTIRGFHSGFKTDKDGTEDNSLVAKLPDMTLVTKDGDTLLQAPNLGQVLAEARDLFDTTSRSYYRNKMGRDYQGIRWTWILCGTTSLKQIDASELGERFLDCIIMEGINDEEEDEVLWRVANKAARDVTIIADGKLETQHSKEMLKAMQLTGGYVDYLRKNADTLLKKVEMSDEAKHQCIRLGKFVAHMRARPSKHQEDIAEREFGARLVSQMVRLSKCLAVVLNKEEVDDDVLKRVTQVAMDTSRGRTLELVRHLYQAGDKGAYLQTLAHWTNQTEDKERNLLRFLRNIGVVTTFDPTKGKSGLAARPKWKLRARMRQLVEDLVGRAEQ
jgi:hypothetical protein